MKKKKKPLEFLAIEILENLGNSNPTQKHIELMDSILSNIVINRAIFFNAKLSKREISCLYWAAKGKTSEETAELLQISSATVESHRKQIKRKLGCYGLTQAVFEGMRFGYFNSHHPLQSL